jgi:3-deoxy-D-manno-octulosonate 8-phosphate phosphatase (KDO 8-P phosphatase)
MPKKNDQIEKLARKIKLLILDVDGVLTDNCLLIDDNGMEYKKFNVSDGLGIRLLQESGVKVALISGRPSPATHHRALQLKIEHVYLGKSHKLEAYDDLKRKLDVADEEIVYLGDDLLDIPVLKKVGLPVCVQNAYPVVKRCVKLVTKAKGGEGAVREVVDLILKAKKKNPLERI